MWKKKLHGKSWKLFREQKIENVKCLCTKFQRASVKTEAYCSPNKQKTNERAKYAKMNQQK